MDDIIHCEDCEHCQKWGGLSTELKCSIGVLDCPAPHDFCSKAKEKARWIVETFEHEPMSPTDIYTTIKTCKCPKCDGAIPYEYRNEYKYCPYCGLKMSGGCAE